MAGPGAEAPPVCSGERVRLSVEATVDLVLCGVLIAALPFLAQHLQPDLTRATLFTGWVGGGLCVLWGILGRRGMCCRWVAMVTLVIVAVVFVRQAVQSWGASPVGESKPRMVAMLMALLVVFCVGMVANLAREERR